MLKKLFKYDIKYMNKYILPLCGLSFILSIFTRILFELSSYSIIFKIFFMMSIIVTNTLLINVLIQTIVRIIARFKNSLYSDESYLIHTLPVARKDIFLSKFLMSMLYMLIAFIVVAICLIIEYYTKDRFESLKTILNTVFLQYDMSLKYLLFIGLSYLILMFAWIQLMVFSAVELGFRKNDRKGLMSFAYSIALYFGTQVVNLIILMVVALFNSGIRETFTSNVMSSATLKIILLVITIYNFVYVIFYYALGQKLLSKNVNVE